MSAIPRTSVEYASTATTPACTTVPVAPHLHLVRAEDAAADRRWTYVLCGRVSPGWQYEKSLQALLSEAGLSVATDLQVDARPALRERLVGDPLALVYAEDADEAELADVRYVAGQFTDYRTPVSEIRLVPVPHEAANYTVEPDRRVALVVEARRAAVPLDFDVLAEQLETDRAARIAAEAAERATDAAEFGDDDDAAPEPQTTATSAPAAPRADDAAMPWRLPASYVVPEGWRVAKGGVLRLRPAKGGHSESWEPILPMSIWIAERYAGAVGGMDVWLRIEGRTPASKTVNLTRSLADLSSRAEVARAFAAAGFVGVHDGTALRVIEHLHAALAANEGTLPTVATARRVGTERDADGRVTALVHGGRRYTTAGVEEVRLSPGSPFPADKWTAYATRGTAEGWGAEVLTPIRRGGYDHVLAVMGAALASLLNAPLGTMPMMLALFGRGGVGKTSAMEVAASAAGRASGICHTFRGNDNGLEAVLGAHGDLPAYLDEVGTAKGGPGQDAAKMIERIVYMGSAGQGAMRMKRTGDGAREIARWSCNIIATGELDPGAVSAHQGIRRRVMTLSGAPWGAQSDAMAELVNGLRDAARRHYGHALPAVAVRLIGLSDEQMDALRARHAAIARAWADRTVAAVDRGMVGDMARQFANMEVVLGWLFEAFPGAAEDGSALPPAGEVLLAPWQAITAQLRTASRPQRVLDCLAELVAGRRGEFATDSGATCFGRVLGRITDEFVAFMPEALAAHLRASGFAYETDRALLAEDGHLVPDSKGNPTRVVAFGANRVRCLCVKLTSLRLAGDTSPMTAEELLGPPLAAPTDDASAQQTLPVAEFAHPPAA